MTSSGLNQESCGSVLEIVRQANAALATINVASLEELAGCCADLDQFRSPLTLIRSRDADRDLVDCVDVELRILEQVLAETRSNLSMLERLYTEHEGRMPGIFEIGERRRKEVVSWEQSMQP